MPKGKDLHAAIAMQAVNMLGGVHWLHSPIPHILLTRLRIRSCSCVALAEMGLVVRSTCDVCGSTLHGTYIDPLRSFLPLRSHSRNFGVEAHEE